MIQKKRLIDSARQLIRINSENPPGNEAAIADLLTAQLRECGLRVKTYNFAPGRTVRRPNVVATLKGTWCRPRAAAGAVLISPHIDTVPIGRGWRHDPLAGEVVRGRLYGRGATDDKGNLASCLEVMQSLVEDGVRLKRDIILAATADEEAGSHYGIIPLLAKGLVRPAAAVIVDSDEFKAVIVQKGLLHCRLQIFGKKAHGAYVWQGINAIEIAGRVIGRLKAHRFIFKRHPLLRGPTVNVGTIKGGDKVNMVADYCEFSLDIRFLPGMEPRPLIRSVKDIISKEARRFRFIVDDQQPPYAISPAHPLVCTYLDAARAEKVRAGLSGSEGATVMTFFRKYGIPAFATGFGASGTAHTTDEYASVEALYKGARVLQRFLVEYDTR